MTWARGAVGLGLLLLVGSFYLGVDTPISTTAAGQSYHCADVIPAGLLPRTTTPQDVLSCPTSGTRPHAPRLRR